MKKVTWLKWSVLSTVLSVIVVYLVLAGNPKGEVAKAYALPPGCMFTATLIKDGFTAYINGSQLQKGVEVSFSAQADGNAELAITCNTGAVKNRGGIQIVKLTAYVMRSGQWVVSDYKSMSMPDGHESDVLELLPVCNAPTSATVILVGSTPYIPDPSS